MKVHLRQIPAEGLHLEGEEDCPIPDLEAKEVQCAGPLRYSLDIGISEGALWANGALRNRLSCVASAASSRFRSTSRCNEFALHIELTGPELVDLTPFVREDILLNLARVSALRPRGRRVCQAGGDKNLTRTGVQQPEARQPDWSALDKLKICKA